MYGRDAHVLRDIGEEFLLEDLDDHLERRAQQTEDDEREVLMLIDADQGLVVFPKH